MNEAEEKHMRIWHEELIFHSIYSCVLLFYKNYYRLGTGSTFLHQPNEDRVVLVLVKENKTIYRIVKYFKIRSGNRWDES
jgi:hypothetical protein